MGVVFDVEAQIDGGGLAREGLDLGLVDVNLQIRQVRQNVLEDAYAIDHLDTDLHRVGLARPVVIATIPTDGNDAIARYVGQVGTALAMDGNAPAAQGNAAHDRLTGQGATAARNVVHQALNAQNGGFRGGYGTVTVGAGDRLGQKLVRVLQRRLGR